MTESFEIRSTSPLPSVLPASFDMGRVIAGINKFVNPLAQECVLKHQVHRVEDGVAYVTFALPVDMTRCFVAFLEAMAGQFRVINVKERSVASECKEVSLDELEEGQRVRAEFQAQVCEFFDGFGKEGKTVKEAISLTNIAMKEKGHPWANYPNVVDTLRAAGRFRTKYKKRM